VFQSVRHRDSRRTGTNDNNFRTRHDEGSACKVGIKSK
jgi:hypothetical protein